MATNTQGKQPVDSWDVNLAVNGNGNGIVQTRTLVADAILIIGASQNFFMSFDGTTFFKAFQGLKITDLRKFNTENVWVKCQDNLPSVVNIVYGDANIDSSQVTIVQNLGSILNVFPKIPMTYKVGTNQVIVAGGQLVIPGINNNKQRKDITVSNLDNAGNTLILQTQGGQNYAPVYSQDNYPDETSDTVVITNPTAVNIAVMVAENYYTI